MWTEKKKKKKNDTFFIWFIHLRETFDDTRKKYFQSGKNWREHRAFVVQTLASLFRGGSGDGGDGGDGADGGGDGGGDRLFHDEPTIYKNGKNERDSNEALKTSNGKRRDAFSNGGNSMASAATLAAAVAADFSDSLAAAINDKSGGGGGGGFSEKGVLIVNKMFLPATASVVWRFLTGNLLINNSINFNKKAYNFLKIQ